MLANSMCDRQHYEGRYSPGRSGIALDQIHREQCIRSQKRKPDQENSKQEHIDRHRIDVLRRISEQNRTKHATQQRNDQTQQMRLRLTNPAIPPRMPIRDLVRHEPTKEPHKRTRNDNRYHSQAQHLKLPTRSDEHRGADLAGGALRGDEETVDDDDPENVGEECRLEGLPDGVAGTVPFDGYGEDAKVGLVGTGPVSSHIEAGACLAWLEREYCLSSCDNTIISIIASMICEWNMIIPQGRLHTKFSI